MCITDRQTEHKGMLLPQWFLCSNVVLIHRIQLLHCRILDHNAEHCWIIHLQDVRIFVVMFWKKKTYREKLIAKWKSRRSLVFEDTCLDKWRFCWFFSVRKRFNRMLFCVCKNRMSSEIEWLPFCYIFYGFVDFSCWWIIFAFTAQAAQIKKGINSHFESARMPWVV